MLIASLGEITAAVGFSPLLIYLKCSQYIGTIYLKSNKVLEVFLVWLWPVHLHDSYQGCDFCCEETKPAMQQWHFLVIFIVTLKTNSISCQNNFEYIILIFHPICNFENITESWLRLKHVHNKWFNVVFVWLYCCHGT